MLGRDEVIEKTAARTRPAFVHQRAEILAQARRGDVSPPHDLRGGRHDLQPSAEVSGPGLELLAVLDRNAEQLADDLNRQRVREVAQKVRLALPVKLSGQLIDQLIDARLSRKSTI